MARARANSYWKRSETLKQLSQDAREEKDRQEKFVCHHGAGIGPCYLCPTLADLQREDALDEAREVLRDLESERD